MMTVLIILCALMILFAGGCALVAIGAGALPMAAIPGGLVAANVLVILAVLGRRAPAFGAFVSLAVLDLLIGLPMTCIVLTNPIDEPFVFGMLVFAIALVIKGILTIAAASQLRKQGRHPVVDGDSQAEHTSGW